MANKRVQRGNVDVDSHEATALRRLQELDQLIPIDRRDLLIAAQDALGARLGVRCTGNQESDDPLSYDHSGDTCPIHEWLVPSDGDGLERGA